MMKSKYTIYAEYVNKNARDFMASFFLTYDHTLTKGLGYFDGIQEKSMRIDIIMDDELYEDRRRLMDDLKEFNRQFCLRYNQKCIFVTRSKVEIIEF